jgi:hypothetical protein
MSKRIYVLLHKERCLTACFSKKKLGRAVDYWVAEIKKDEKLDYLTFFEFQPKYMQEPVCWGWAYVSTSITKEEINAAGGSIDFMPPIHLREMNLVKEDNKLQAAYDLWFENL